MSREKLKRLAREAFGQGQRTRPAKTIVPTPEQRKAAGAELRRRREGNHRQTKETRPFGAESTEMLRTIAKGARDPR